MAPTAPRSPRPTPVQDTLQMTIPDPFETRKAASQGSFIDAGGELVTVVVPAFNAAATLAATLDSVRCQTHAALEILVVDDGSTDDTHEIAQNAARLDPRVRIIRQANAGVAAARNAGIAAARGVYIAPVDADDLWHPRKIELQLGAARRVGDALGFVYCWSRRVDGNGRILADLGAQRCRGDVFCDLVVSNFVRNASNALIPTDRIRDIGGFDPQLRALGAQGAEDLKVFLALAETGFVDVVPAFLVGYRTSRASMSRAAIGMRRSIGLVVAEVARRRPDLPKRLFDLAMVNYDLYAADIALRRSDLRAFSSFLDSALRRDPVTATRLLTAAVRDRASYRIGRKGNGTGFFELDPEHSVHRWRRSNRVDDLLEAATRRALSGRDAPGFWGLGMPD